MGLHCSGATSPAPPVSVLVVDDEHDTADSFAVLLRLSGYDVRAVYDGPGAIGQLNGWQPAVVLLDIKMAGCDGVTLREQICRAAIRRPRFIAVTGLGTRPELEQVEAAGFDHVLLKPVAPDDLLAILSSAAPPPGR
jgi:CheY-like chemotaxis protein